MHPTLAAGPTFISHVLEHVLSSFNTAGKLLFLEKVHVPKLTRASEFAAAHGCRLPPADSVPENDAKTGHLPAWLDFGQLLVS